MNRAIWFLIVANLTVWSLALFLILSQQYSEYIVTFPAETVKGIIVP